MKSGVKLFLLVSLVLGGTVSCSLESDEQRGCMHSGLHMDDSDRDRDIVAEQYEDQKQKELNNK